MDKYSISHSTVLTMKIILSLYRLGFFGSHLHRIDICKTFLAYYNKFNDFWIGKYLSGLNSFQSRWTVLASQTESRKFQNIGFVVLQSLFYKFLHCYELFVHWD